MKKNINFEKTILDCFLLLFLFSNLLERITKLNFNTLFYIIYFILIILSINYINLNKINKCLILLITFYFLSIFNMNSNLKANIMSIKDVLIPFFCFFIAYIFIKYKQSSINLINKLYLPFILYGIFQEVVFYEHKMASILPWDNIIIEQMLSSGTSSNMFQTGGLLRFWGCMNSFVEYQVSVVFIICLVWLYKDKVKNKVLLNTNLILMITFLCLAIERSPIMMLLILIVFWKHKEILTNIKKIITVGVIFFTCVLLLSAFSEKISNNPMISGAYKRLYNAITFNLDEDEAVTNRKNNQWNMDKEIVSDPKTFFGLGPATIAPSSKKYFDGYIGPHNNFLGYYIGYGFLGFFLFICFLVMMLKSLNKLNNKYNCSILWYGNI